MTTRVWTELGAFYWRFTVIPVGRGPSGLSGGGRIEFAGGFLFFFHDNYFFVAFRSVTGSVMPQEETGAPFFCGSFKML